MRKEHGAGPGLALAIAVAMVLGPPAGGPQASCATTTPELPRLHVDTTYVAPTGDTLAVPAGGDLQAALERANPGDVITLEAGATFVGPFTLPHKGGPGWIIVRTSAPDGSLPPPGTRVDPSYARVMPKIEARSGPAITAAPRAHHFRFIGLEIRPKSGAFVHNLVLLGEDETSIQKLPHHIIFDRCYLHGDPRRGTRRGIALNSRETAVIDSHLADFKEAGADSQALAGWNGPGPFKIVNNYLEGAGENVIFGGTAPAIRNLVPSDIDIRRNHFFKPLAWKVGDPSYQGTPWTVKNLFELKNARRVLLEQNLLENNWVHAQNGFGILLTVRTELDAAPWAVVEDVTFRNNVVRHTASGFNILGIDDGSPSGSGRTRRIAIVNNLFEDVGGPRWGGAGILFQILNGAAGLLIDHNTAFHTGHVIAADMAPSPELVFKNNIASHNEYGVFGGGKGSGIAAIGHYFPDSVFARNVIAATPKAVRYPPDNFYPESLAATGFADLAGRDYRLSPSSPYRRAGTDGRDAGADLDALFEALRAAQGHDPERTATPEPGEGCPGRVRS